MYTCFFASNSYIKDMEHLLPGSNKHISCNAMLLLMFASQALQVFSPPDPALKDCYITLTDKFKEDFCKTFESNERSYKRYIKELKDARLIHLINKKEGSYFINPYVVSRTDNLNVLRYMREYFSANNIFDDLARDKSSFITEKYCKLSFSMQDIASYSAVIGREINFTELIVFLMLAADSKFCNASEHPRKRIVTINGKRVKKLAAILNIGESTFYRTLNNLCECHLLLKTAGVNCEYVIDPIVNLK